jgi:dCTP deaminase
VYDTAIEPDKAMLLAACSLSTGGYNMLSRRDILRRMDATNLVERLVVTPLLDSHLQVQQGGIDLRLGVAFIVARHSRTAALDPVEHSKSQIPIENFQEFVYIPIGEYLVLHPGETVLGATVEYIVLPHDVAGLIIGRSSWGRLGLTIATALKVNPGNCSCITLELVNHGRLPIKLYPGMRIGQLVLFELSESESMTSRYGYDIGPAFSKLYLDGELPFLGTSPSPTQSVVGITGLINSGKSRIARRIAQALGFVLTSPSMILKKELDKHRQVSVSPDEAYRLKVQFRKDQKKPDFFVARAIQEAIMNNPQGIVVDGLDHPREISYLKKKFTNFRLVAVVADDVWRGQQYKALNGIGDSTDRDQFEATDKRSCQGLDLDGSLNDYADNLDECMKDPNYVIESGKEDTEQQIEDTIESLRSLLRSGHDNRWY